MTLAVYAWKDWYVSLCGLILLMAFVEHPDMPKAMLNIRGLNPWNMGFTAVLMAWAFKRKTEGLTWDMPRQINILLLLYLVVIVVGFSRMMSDRDGLGTLSGKTTRLTNEYLINSIKWVLPGLLLFDGCRSRSRLVLALLSLIGIYVFLGGQVIKWMPLSSALSGKEFSDRSLRVLLKEVGYHRVNLSMMFAGASWATFSMLPLINRQSMKLCVIGAALVIVLGQVLTGGRAGYVTWAILGLILGVIRWRKYLLLLPLVVGVVLLAAPGVQDRIFEGFSAESRDFNPHISQETDYDQDLDIYTITAGRNVAWPAVIEKIKESPIFGYGRLAMRRTGITAYLWTTYREGFGHPHSAYLEMLLDNGCVGFIIVVPFYLAMAGKALSLFRDSRSPVYVAIGGVALSLILALLLASGGSQTFYPREGSVGMWCAIGLMLRVYVERSRISASSGAHSPDIAAGALWAGVA